MITKVGFDVHGVIDTFPAFVNLMNALIADPNFEVHIITGLSRKHAPDEIGHIVDLDKVVYMSIVDYLIERGDPIVWEDGLPHADKESWDKAKSEYCTEHGIDILFDDSPTYGQYFHTIDTTYCQVHNVNRTVHKTRK
jgi:hypothetical protein